MRRIILFAFLTLLFSSCLHRKENDETINSSFEYYKKGFIERYWQQNPSQALFSGFHKYDSLLLIPSSDLFEKQDHFYKSELDSLKKFSFRSLTVSNKIDYRILENQMRSALWYNDEFRSYEWNPAEYNLGGEFAQMITENYAPLNSRLKAISHKLEKVPLYYQAARHNLKDPTPEHTDLAILQNKGAVSVFENMLMDSLKRSSLDEEAKMEIRVKADAAKQAVLDYVLWLSNEVKIGLSTHNARSFRIGKALYDRKFKYDIVSDFTAEEIYKKAVDRKNQVHKEMASITEKLWPKYFGNKARPASQKMMIKMMIDTLAHTHVHRDSFINAIKTQLPELVKFVSDKSLLYIDPKKPLVVRETPAYMQGVAGASVSSPGPYEQNANTYYNVTPLTRYSPEEAESYLREYNFYILQILNIHEAIPGHYTQLVYSNQSQSLIKSVFGSGSMVEGWAVYTERMMLEEGYGSQSPEMWLMYYKWHLRVVCNTILDYSVHVLNMSREDALHLLMDEAFQEKAEAEGKWRRVSLTQVQLCSYFTGFTEIYEFREEMKKKMGKDFSLKQFHEKFLSFGSAPVKFIKELMK